MVLARTRIRLRFVPTQAENIGEALLAIFIAMIALRSKPKLSGVQIQQDLVSNWPGLQVPKVAEEQDGILSLTFATAEALLAHMPAPIPWSDLEGPCATSILWPHAESELRTHDSHLIVTVSGELSPLELVKLLTQVTTAVLGTCSDVLGVYWGSAALVIPARQFRDFAIKMLPLGPTVELWVDFRVGRNAQGLCSGFTQGLSAFGLMEIETESASERPGELRERLCSISRYLLEKGPVIRDGDSVSNNAKEQIRVVYGPSAFGHEGAVMRLNYETVI